MTVLPSSSANARHAWYVASSVSSPRMISISPMTGTGEKKCRPMNLVGRSVAVARLVMLMLLVFVAKIAPSSATLVTPCHVSRLTASSSKTASTTMSCPAAASVPSAVPMRPSVSSAAGCSSFPFSTWRARLAAIRALPFSASSAVRSESVTVLPAAALTCAIPWPIRPAPMTKTRSMLMEPAGYQPRCRRSVLEVRDRAHKPDVAEGVRGLRDRIHERCAARVGHALRQPEDDRFQATIGPEDEADEPMRLGRRPIEHGEGLVDLDRVLLEMGRHAPEPEADIDRIARPAGGRRQLSHVEARHPLGRPVHRAVESSADLGDRAHAVGLLFGEALVDAVRDALRQLRRLLARQPPRREGRVGALHVQDVRERLPDRPLPAARIRVEVGV